MLKKRIYTKLDAITQTLKNNFTRQSEEHANTRSMIDRQYREHQSKLDNMSKTIASQQRTIEQLTNALKDKYEHGLFIFSEDCKIPMVIRNGEQVTNKLTKSFSIDWTLGEVPFIEIEQIADTFAEEG